MLAMTVTEVRRLLHQLDLRPSKALGQNFLVDGNILRIVVEHADVRADEVVLEVGPGLGVLTEWLLDRARRLIAVEKDRRLCAYLRERFPALDLIEGDAVTVALPAFDKLVANLPYRISTPLLERVVESPRPPRAIVVMLQREVADRLSAQPRSKAYGALTVLTQLRYDAHIAHVVAPGCFYPAPEVESALVVLLRRDPRVPLAPGAPFRDVVRAGFGHRRKMLGKLLRSFGAIPDRLAHRRAEELSVTDWIELANALRG